MSLFIALINYPVATFGSFNFVMTLSLLEIGGDGLNMFEDGGFEIYESTTKTYAIKEIHEVIGGPSKG